MIAVVDYGMGNLGSVAKALEQVGGAVRIVAEPAGLESADRCLLPGVGNFGDGMKNLVARGFAEPVRSFIRSGRPFFGICLGMQMLLESSEEAPGVPGLGVIPGVVKRFPAGVEKIPHMGWNSVRRVSSHPGFGSVEDGDYFYFVHSYYAAPAERSDLALECEYVLPFAAALGRGNVLATQFHPEKSQQAGLELLRAFVTQK